MERKHSLIRNHETKIECGVRVAVCALACIFVLLAVIGNLLATHSTGGNFTISVLVSAAVLCFIAAFAEKTADAYKSWLVFIFIVAFASRLIMLNMWPIEPSSDFANTYKTALALAEAGVDEIRTIMKYSFGYYYNGWSMHMPFILLEMAIIKVFGPGYYPIQVFFAVFSSLSCVVAAAIAKVLYGRRAGIITGIAMSFLPPVLMYSTVLSNQHVATFFFLLAIYILIEKRMKHRLVNVAFASVCIAVSQLIRPEMPVFVVAVLCYFVYKYILGVKNKRKLKALRKKVAGYCVMVLGTCVILVFATSLFINEAGFIENRITQNNYKYKIAVGLNAESLGQWNEADAQYANNTPMLDKLIFERTENIFDLAILGARKTMYQYGTYNYPWCIQGKTGSFVEKWYEPLTNGSMLVILLLCLYKVIMSIFNKSKRELLLLLSLLGYFAVFTIIEVQCRYNYLMIPLFVIFASGALIHLYGYRQILVEKIKKRKENV